MKILNDISYAQSINQLNYRSFRAGSKELTKFPKIIVREFEEAAESRIVDPNDYTMEILKIIRAMKQSRGLRRFLKRYDVKNIEIRDSSLTFGYQNLFGAEWSRTSFNYDIYANEPSLKKDYLVSKRTFFDRVLDWLRKPRNITEDSFDNDFCLLSCSQNKTAPYRIKHLSYLKIISRLLNKCKELKKEQKEAIEKQKLRNKLDI